MPVQSSPLFSAPLTIISLAFSLKDANAALPTVVGRSSSHGLMMRSFLEGNPVSTIEGVLAVEGYDDAALSREIEGGGLAVSAEETTNASD